MKLLFCPWCKDFVTLRHHGWRSCECGTCRGRYVTRTPQFGESDARIEGDRAQVVGVANDELEKAWDHLSRWPRFEGIGDYDYDLVELRFKTWFFGPNARQHTRDTPEA